MSLSDEEDVQFGHEGVDIFGFPCMTAGIACEQGLRVPEADAVIASVLTAGGRELAVGGGVQVGSSKGAGAGKKTQGTPDQMARVSR